MRHNLMRVIALCYVTYMCGLFQITSVEIIAMNMLLCCYSSFKIFTGPRRFHARVARMTSDLYKCFKMDYNCVEPP